LHPRKANLAWQDQQYCVSKGNSNKVSLGTLQNTWHGACRQQMQQLYSTSHLVNPSITTTAQQTHRPSVVLTDNATHDYIATQMATAMLGPHDAGNSSQHR
jgi:hypothetical protein